MDDISRLVFNVEEVAKLLQLGKSSVYKAAMADQIPSIRVGRRVLFPRARLEEFIGEVRGKGVAESGLEAGNSANPLDFGLLTKTEP